MSKIIGIDLGSTESCVAVVENGTPTVIVNSEGNRTTPSVIFYDNKGERVVGDVAKRKALTNPKNTVDLIKRFMCNSYKDTKSYHNKQSYVIKEGANDTVRVVINDKEYTPQEISAAILQKMKKTAEDYLGEEVTEAVITVPAYFDDRARTATKEAGEIAGLTVKRIINEPTAAALAFGVDKLNKNMKLLVYDFGGSTLDISILELGDGVFEVLSTKGDMFLGGNDIDNLIVDWLVNEGKTQCGADLSKDTMAHQRLRDAAEKAKIELSNATQTEINLPYITAVDGVPQHLVCTLTRANFNNMISGIIDRTMNIAKDTLSAAKLSTSDIDEILLVGGSTRIPLVRDRLAEYFGKEPNKSVNPDEAVALGAAIQGAVLSGDQTGIVLLDVTPMNLNITTMGEVAMCMIEANTTIPTKKSQVFSTASDNQPAVDIEVTQGSRALAKDNKRLGLFVLDGILPAKRGVPQIEVTFSIDANGILEVTALDKGTNKKQNIRIEGSSGLSQEEIEQMKNDAAAHADEDKKKMERIQTLNNAEHMIYTTEDFITKNGEEDGTKLSDEDLAPLKEYLEGLKTLYNVKDEDRDVDAIENARKELEKAWHKISEKLVQAAQSADGTSFDPSQFTKAAGSNPGGPVDVEATPVE